MEKKFLRRRQVQEMTGLPVSSLYELMAKGEFPKNFRLSVNRVAWDSEAITAWQNERLAGRPETQTA
jgi:prophage regulatory protein